MAKKSQVEIPDVEEVTELTLPKVFNKRAYSVIQKDGQYHLICVSFNDSLEVGTATIMESNKDSFEIEYSLEQAVEQMMYD
jgi:hypothetical protein